jgi:hypothetical protein
VPFFQEAQCGFVRVMPQTRTKLSFATVQLDNGIVINILATLVSRSLEVCHLEWFSAK